MGSTYGVVTFDCYGTLIDWERGIAGAFTEQARRDGIELDHDAVLAAYAAVEPEIQGGPYRPYREVLALAARAAAERLGWQPAAQRAGFLADSLPGWVPFADVNPALERMAAAGIRLGILSNIDDDLLAATRRHFTVAFEILVTAEQVRSYKPARGHFDEARRRIGATPWLHAAQSRFHDVAPANAHRIPVVWINRTAESSSAPGRPLAEFPSLHGLVSWLGLG